MHEQNVIMHSNGAVKMNWTRTVAQTGKFLWNSLVLPSALRSAKSYFDFELKHKNSYFLSVFYDC